MGKADDCLPNDQIKNSVYEAIYKNVAFQSIGLPDPFPEEDTQDLEYQQILGNNEIVIKDLVYPDCRFNVDYSPRTIFMPTKQVMFKMIRACLGCDGPQDLWYRLNK